MLKLPQKLIRKSTLIVTLASSLLFSYSSLADKYLDNAKKYIEKDDIPAAVIELKNSIQNSPNEALPRVLLGQIYLQQGSFLDAEKELTRSIELGATREDIVPLLMRVKLNMAKNQEVIDYIDANRLSDPYVNSELLALKAIAELNLNQLDAAKQSLQLAGDTALDSQYVKLSQARLDAAQRNISQALSIVEGVININESNTDAWLLKGHLEMAQKSYDLAADSYRKAYQISPKASYYTLFISRALVMGGQLEQAQPYVDSILKHSPNQILANDLKATIDFSNSDFESAKQHADRALNNGSNSLSAALISGISAYRLKLYEQANNRLRQVLPRLPDDHFARRLYIATQFKLGYIDEAIKELAELNTDSKETSAFLAQSSMELSKLGRNEEALELAQKAYESDGGQFNEMMLGMVKLSGNDASGIEDLKSAIQEQPDQRKAELGIGYYYLQLGAFDEANEIADKWLKADNKDADALTLKATVFQALQEIEKAKQTYQEALSIDPEHQRANVLYAQILTNAGEWEEAFKYAYKAKQLSPNDKSATKLLYITSKQANKTAELLELINALLSQDPNNLDLIPQKAMALVLNGETNQALRLLENQPEQNKTANVWAMIGNVYFAQEQWTDAERAYLKWLALAPTEINAHIRSVFISGVTKKYDSGIVLADKAMQLFPNDIRFSILKVELLNKSGKTERAQRELDAMDPKVKKLEYVLKQQAFIYVTNNELDKALNILKQRYSTYPSLESAKDLTILYTQMKQYENATEFLSQVIKQHPDKARSLQLLLADVESKHSPDRAIEQYEKIVAREPNNVIALNNLAWVHMDKNEYSTACQYSKRAFDLANGHPQISDTHGYCLLKNGDIKTAVSILEKAYQAISTYPEIALHYAESLIADGQIQQAKIVLDRIVTNDTKFLNQKKALEIKVSSI